MEQRICPVQTQITAFVKAVMSSYAVGRWIPDDTIISCDACRSMRAIHRYMYGTGVHTTWVSLCDNCKNITIDVNSRNQTIRITKTQHNLLMKKAYKRNEIHYAIHHVLGNEIPKDRCVVCLGHDLCHYNDVIARSMHIKMCIALLMYLCEYEDLRKEILRRYIALLYDI